MAVNLPKAVKNGIFQQNLRPTADHSSNQVSTLPRERSSLDSKYYSREQREKDDALMKMHKEFAPVLQMLLHTSIQTLRESDDTVSAKTLLSEVQNSAFDLCQILFDFFLARISCSLVVISSRRPQVYLSPTILALTSLLGLNPNRPWLLRGITI